ncbi:MAG TPA: di-trans,poly-cis-decaprenylcistransferase [Terriglobales bacterium]|nr:di-trans,poly-cis-decaprenylcistransferase [Terriglobales bacterium]
MIHVGIIMDGNGRWAQSQGLPRVAGHRAGARSVRRVVEAAPDLGISTLTLYAFSSDNWKRPRAEVVALMRLFQSYLRSEVAELRANGVKLSIIGRRDRLPQSVLREMRRAESQLANGTKLHLRVAVDYSARGTLLAAARAMHTPEAATPAGFARVLGAAMNLDGPSPDVDLIVRTGGEQRLSDFLLWEAAYAELVFSPRWWPDFDADDLAAAVAEFHRRQRRFGAVPDALEERINHLPVPALST